MSQISLEFEPKTCEMCGKEHTQGGDMCGDIECAEKWIELYMSPEALEPKKN